MPEISGKQDGEGETGWGEVVQRAEWLSERLTVACKGGQFNC